MTEQTVTPAKKKPAAKAKPKPGYASRPYPQELKAVDLPVLSFFAGAGGLDTGFKNAGFTVPWANEYDKRITPTLAANFPDTYIDDRSLFKISLDEIPSGAVGLVGGPPCQSWSLGGAGRGLADKRGEVFLEYINVIEDKQPLFFLAENVKGMLAKTRKDDLEILLERFNDLGYNLAYHLVNAHDYGVPEDRWRVIFVGYRSDMGKSFQLPMKNPSKPNLASAIWDLQNSAVPAKATDKTNGDALAIANHEYSTDSFSSQYMSRNRTRLWDEPSFTIQASGRQAPLHPSSGLMTKVSTDVRSFAEGSKVRRLSVREAARVQTFPDSHKFVYDRVELGYKMVGNAVPVKLAEAFANQIMGDVREFLNAGGTLEKN